jgi:hypothetical protein
MLPGAIFTVDLYHRYYSTIRRPLPRNAHHEGHAAHEGPGSLPRCEQEMGRI